ncbi:basic proline-rich protein-like [Loxodonta africana]|uniref:basic proline-rich protein-like n=1 Tax=Loxodonta africana TaxID=9785 RepID=UPI0005403A1C
MDTDIPLSFPVIVLEVIGAPADVRPRAYVPKSWTGRTPRAPGLSPLGTSRPAPTRLPVLAPPPPRPARRAPARPAPPPLPGLAPPLLGPAPSAALRDPPISAPPLRCCPGLARARTPREQRAGLAFDACPSGGRLERGTSR